jgi:NAD(P)-dependent dehydrogenase (short-subunit alcohol dehydrogenase family)
VADVVMITGCSSGFGLATALEFARRGDRVFATMRNLDKVKPLLDAADAAGVDVETLALDVTDDDSVRQAVDAVLETVGRIDVLVNNAGISHYGTVELMPWDWLREMMETNFFGPVRMIRAVLPSMRAQRSGAIVNISSVSGRIPGFPFVSLYSASKHALGTLSESLAVEVDAFNIRVAIIEPGWFKTNIVANGGVILDPASPYSKLEAAEYATEQAAVDVAADPRIVAAAVVHAATHPGPLHVLVGDDAQSWCAAASEMTFEEWADMTKAELGI